MTNRAADEFRSAARSHDDSGPTDLSAWVGRVETRADRIGPTPFAALNSMLDHPPHSSGEVPDGTPLPPLWHWLYFLPIGQQSDIGEDGHPKRGGFMPPVPLPRRMWAGSHLTFHAPVRVGDAVERISTIESVTSKAGRSGHLVFVKLRHAVHCNGGADPAIVEFQDIVYREAKRAGDTEPPARPAPMAQIAQPAPIGSSAPMGPTATVAVAGAAWQRELVPDPVLLFRYSALTFNSHRIHYDRPYASAVEGYPGLVVHGPLLATLLIDLLRREAPNAEVASFTFKAVRPTFDGAPLQVRGHVQPDGRTVRLWTQDHQGALTMEAEAVLR